MDHCNESANWPAQSVTMIEQYVRTIVAVTSCTNIQQLYVCKSTLYNKLCGMQLVACVSRWSKDITESAIYTLRIYKNSFPFSAV